MNESFKIPAKLGWTCGTEMKINNKLNNLVLIEKELLWAVKRVNELHKQVPGPYDDYICDHCSSFTPFASEVIPYPCPTIKAINYFEGE
jgi:hypothetical protein